MPLTPRIPGESSHELHSVYEALSRLKHILHRPEYENAEQLERARSEAISIADDAIMTIGGLL